MLKKILACTVASLFVLVGSASCFAAADPGPADITIVGEKSKKPKPAIFPHKAHQDKIGCGECHHGMADGKQVPYTDGQEIGKCESCHNKDVLAGKTMEMAGKKKPTILKLDTIKGAGHGNCLVCHKKIAAENADLKKIAKCSACHPKKK